MVDNDVMTANSISIVFMRCSTYRNDSLFDVIHVRSLSTKTYGRLFTIGGDAVKSFSEPLTACAPTAKRRIAIAHNPLTQDQGFTPGKILDHTGCSRRKIHAAIVSLPNQL